MPSPLTTLEPGHPAARVLQHMQQNKLERIDRDAAARVVGIHPRLMLSKLEEGVAAGVLRAANDGDVGPVWMPGSVASEAAAAPAPAQATTAPAARGPRGGRRPRLPLLDVSSLVVRSDLPLPVSRIAKKGETSYDQVFQQLSAPGQAITNIPARYQAALNKALQTYCKRRPGLVLTCRAIPGTDTCGVWRLNDKLADVAAKA